MIIVAKSVADKRTLKEPWQSVKGSLGHDHESYKLYWKFTTTDSRLCGPWLAAAKLVVIFTGHCNTNILSFLSKFLFKRESAFPFSPHCSQTFHRTTCCLAHSLVRDRRKSLKAASEWNSFPAELGDGDL